MVNKQPHVASKAKPNKPNNYLLLSIFNIVCCTLLGFIPLYYSIKVNTSCIHTHVYTYRYKIYNVTCALTINNVANYDGANIG